MTRTDEFSARADTSPRHGPYRKRQAPRSVASALLAGAMMGPLVLAASVSSATPGAVAPVSRAPAQTHAQAVQDFEPAPYEIVYEITLKEVSERSGILLASGELFSKLEGATCEGWTSTSRMKVRFVFERRGVRDTESRVSSWESGDGNQYNSLIKRYLNGARMETIRVSVSRSRAGEPFTLEMTEPERRKAALPAETLFPTAALKKLVMAAREGRGVLTMLLYEGDKEAAPQRVVAIIGKRQEGGFAAASSGGDEVPPPRARNKGKDTEKERAAQRAAEELRHKPYWPVSLAYYGAEGAGITAREKDRATADREAEERRFGLPEYEVHFRLYDNGVAGDAMLIYPDYVLQARVKSLRLLPMPACK